MGPEFPDDLIFIKEPGNQIMSNTRFLTLAINLKKNLKDHVGQDCWTESNPYMGKSSSFGCYFPTLG